MNKSNISKKTIHNRRAYYEYNILDTLTAGLVLVGTEVKSIKQGHCQLSGAFARIDKKQYTVYLYGAIISQYSHGSDNNHNPDRTRKLLLNKHEINKWRAKVDREKLTIVPLKIFFKKSLIKLELGLAKRKQKHDKREDLKQKDIKRALKNQQNY